MDASARAARAPSAEPTMLERLAKKRMEHEDALPRGPHGIETYGDIARWWVNSVADAIDASSTVEEDRNVAAWLRDEAAR